MRLSICRRSSWLIPGYFLPYPTGIISIKRTSTGSSSARLTMVLMLSSSEKRDTEFSFTFNPSEHAALIELRTVSSPSVPVSSRYFSRSSVSRLMFTASRPLSISPGSIFSRRIPFVVIDTFSIPGTDLISLSRIGSPILTVGSPPVSRIWRNPSSAACSTTDRISSYVRMSFMGKVLMPSGIQYLHLRLHLSVTEIRR